MERLGQQAVAHGLHHLDDTAHTPGGLRMADVGLQRADQYGTVRRTVLPVRGEQRTRLDRVAQRSAGAMGLDRVDLLRRQGGVGERLADHPLLGAAVGRGETVAGTVLVDGGAAHQSQHLVAVAAGVRKSLQQQHADALAEAHAVGALGERLAAAVLCQSALPGEADEPHRGAHDGGATREGEGAVALAQRLAGQVEGDQ
ncbi:putative protein OS=Streptomyces antimycoticus OX=68175 GN=SANT12839_011010 PE=4 SV=1 [Streptomyces antimycoticus]